MFLPVRRAQNSHWNHAKGAQKRTCPRMSAAHGGFFPLACRHSPAAVLSRPSLRPPAFQRPSQAPEQPFVFAEASGSDLSMSAMNTLDVVILLVLGITLVRGLFRGFVGEISSIVGLIIGFILANRYHEQVQPLAKSILPDQALANLVSYVLIFLTGVVVVLSIAALLRHLLKITLLGWLDRLTGATMGLIKGGLLCILIVLLLTTFLSPKAEILHTSRFAPYVNQFSSLLADLMPPNLRREFDEKSQPLREQWRERVQERLLEP